MFLRDPDLFLSEAGEQVILDEIQYVPEILPYIKMKIDRERDKTGRFIMTGSCRFTLMKGMTESLAGRVGILELLPFSKQEIGKISDLKGKTESTLDNFTHACLTGSFPEVNTVSGIEPERWYGMYMATYLERDIRAVYNVGMLREFHRFIELLAARCSQVLNMNRLASDLGISVNTVKQWISVLEATRMIYVLEPYYRNLGKRITKSQKVYFLDSGLVSYLTGHKGKEHLLKGPMSGALFENYCIQETVKTFFNSGERPRLYYLRTHNRLEIDLIVERGMVLYPIEIKLSKTPNIKMASPIQRFKKLFGKLEIAEGRIVSLSEEEMKISRDVSVQTLDNYIKWLQGKNSIQAPERER
jgi:predicted AAA+ superfamily ATPase